MRKSLVFLTSIAFLLGSLAALPAAAQTIQGLPQVSQKSTLTQTVGIADVTVVYHRPAVRGREIWGALVPYDAVWRAGANENTVITFSHAVQVEGQELAAGTYGLHMVPGEGEWQVAFSSNSTSWGSFSYREDEDVLRVTVKPQKAPFQEWLSYGWDDLSNQSATLALSWEELRVPIRVDVDTHAHVLAKIRNDLRSIPGFSWQGWASAANYCRANDINHEEALGWAERSISMQPGFQNQVLKAGILTQMGREGEAEEILAQVADQGTEQEVNTVGYQYLQLGKVERAIALFQKNVEDHPDSWNTYDSLAEGYATKGDKAKAIELYAKALEMAPENQKPRITAILDDLRS